MAKGKSGLGMAMKRIGRNMARANQQKASAKAPSPFAGGGAVAMPKSGDMAAYSGDPISGGGFGSGKARGGGAATKGKRFGGTF